MNVSVLSHSSLLPVIMACRTCYNSRNKSDSTTGAVGPKDVALLRRVIASGHTGVVEHWAATFSIEGISRACSHQLVRHRVASFSMQSQRYVEASTDFDRIMPQSIIDAAFGVEVADLWERTGRLYASMVESGIPPEDARYILPNAAETKLVMTMNARELLHAFNLRCCNRAQWEIRDLFNEILRLVKPIAPAIFENAGASCVNGPCPEGAMGCGKRKE